MNLSDHELEPRQFHKLETLRTNIEVDFTQLHNGVKHYEYETIGEFSEKFSKDVMHYLNDYRHLKSSLNGSELSEEQQSLLEDCQQFMGTIQHYLDQLKSLSKSYKKNDNFNHTTELRRIMENEDIRIIELEQALQATTAIE